MTLPDILNMFDMCICALHVHEAFQKYKQYIYVYKLILLANERSDLMGMYGRQIYRIMHFPSFPFAASLSLDDLSLSFPFLSFPFLPFPLVSSSLSQKKQVC
jgi:hypothetical protein